MDKVRRSDDEILAAHKRFWDRVWYMRHRELVLDGDVEPNESAQRIEAEYGWENLRCESDYERGLLEGRMSALAWVLGSGWKESLDT
jgi:hypothetical protein